MKTLRQVWPRLVLSAAAVAACAACSGDDTAGPASDGGARDGASDASAGSDGGADASTGSDGGATDAAHDTGPEDARADAVSDASTDASDASDAGDAAIATRLLLSYNGSTTSELVAFDVDKKLVAGRLSYPGFIGTTSTQSPDPYVLEQSNDVVAKLDRGDPWVVRSSWSVKLADRADGGASYSDPDGVVVATGAKAYALRYTRNQIAILDTSQTADAGAPIGTIDLSTFVQPADTDGTVEMSGAVYVASKRLVYVLLANINRANVSSDGFTLLCSQTTPTVIAIDVDTDKVVNLSGGNASGALVVGGYNPSFGGGFAYDAQNDRLLVSEAGCNEAGADGGTGPLFGRGIEAVSLFTGTTTTLLDATTLGFPSGFTFIDPHRAIVQFDFTGFETFLWDPAVATLGPAIPNAPDSFVYDGMGSLLGLVTNYGADGGVSGIDVVSVRIADGRKTVLGSNPFTLTSGFVGGVDLWPHP
jgi:hypothetical protein